MAKRPKIQTLIPPNMDRKLDLYSAYLGLSKNDYIRQIITLHLRQAEQTTIPKAIIESAEIKETQN